MSTAFDQAHRHSTSSLEGTNTSSLVSSVWSWKPISWEWWVILQMIIALLGIVGNMLVITLLFQRRKKSKSTDLLIGTLAIADLFTSIFMIPLPSPVRVPSTILGEIYCKVVFTSYFMWVSVVASVLNLTIIPVERYIAIVYPFRFKEFLSRKKLVTAVVLTWVIGFMVNFFSFIATVDGSTGECTLAYPFRAMQLIIGVVHFTVEFLIPALIIIIMQLLTALALHRQSRIHLGANKHLDRSKASTRHLIAKRRVLWMLFTVVFVFFVCWGPDQILYLAYNVGLMPVTFLYSPLYRALVVLSLCNSCANPIIYTVSYPDFRRAIKELITRSKQSKTSLFDDRANK